MEINWIMIIGIALSALGFIQYLKGILKKIPNIIWGILLPFVISGISILFLYIPVVGIILLALSVTQLGYETLFQILLKFIKNAIGGDIKSDNNGNESLEKPGNIL